MCSRIYRQFLDLRIPKTCFYFDEKSNLETREMGVFQRFCRDFLGFYKETHAQTFLQRAQALLPSLEGSDAPQTKAVTAQIKRAVEEVKSKTTSPPQDPFWDHIEILGHGKLVRGETLSLLIPDKEIPPALLNLSEFKFYKSYLSRFGQDSAQLILDVSLSHSTHVASEKLSVKFRCRCDMKNGKFKDTIECDFNLQYDPQNNQINVKELLPWENLNNLLCSAGTHTETQSLKTICDFATWDSACAMALLKTVLKDRDVSVQLYLPMPGEDLLRGFECDPTEGLRGFECDPTEGRRQFFQMRHDSLIQLGWTTHLSLPWSQAHGNIPPVAYRKMLYTLDLKHSSKEHVDLIEQMLAKGQRREIQRSWTDSLYGLFSSLFSGKSHVS